MKLNEQYTIYCDMDGVLTDFIGAVCKVLNRPINGFDEWNHIKKDQWKKITEHGVEFWSEMEWKNDGKELWNYLTDIQPIKILSAFPIRPENKEFAKAGKLGWITKNLKHHDDIWLCKGIEKQNWANKRSILIDDSRRNIEQWRAQGGIGIWHHNTRDTIKQLEWIL